MQNGPSGGTSLTPGMAQGLTEQQGGNTVYHSVSNSVVNSMANSVVGSVANSVVNNAEAYAEWVDLVERIRTGQIDGMAELYHLFSRGIRFYLCRQLGPQELDDRVHDTFVVVVQAIRKGELREPERLMGFVRTIVRHCTARIARSRFSLRLVTIYGQVPRYGHSRETPLPPNQVRHSSPSESAQ